jgi:hypothetical protein
LEHDLLAKTGSHFSKIMLDAADGCRKSKPWARNGVNWPAGRP